VSGLDRAWCAGFVRGVQEEARHPSNYGATYEDQLGDLFFAVLEGAGAGMVAEDERVDDRAVVQPHGRVDRA
jgi:hypothetical protein